MAFFGLNFDELIVTGSGFDGDVAVLVGDFELRVVVNSGKDSASGERVEARVGVTAGDEDAFFCCAVFMVPFDGDAVGGVLAIDAGERWEKSRADLFETDETNPCDGVTFHKLRPEILRQMRLNDIGRDPVVQEKATPDDSFDRGDFHRVLLRDEVEDEDVVEDGLKDLDEGLVVGMGKIDVESGTILEGDDEAMGEAFGAIFGADIGAPLEVGDGVDLAFEGGEFLLDGFNLSRFSVFLELEADDVAESSGCFLFGGGSFFVMIGHGENWNEGGEGNEYFFHGAAV